VRFAVFIPVGPGESELARLRDLTESLACFTGGDATLVVTDDDPTPRNLPSHVTWALERVVSLPPAAAPAADAPPNDRMTSSTLRFMAWLARSGCDYGLKLDTDALVIGDFRPRIERAFSDQRAGILGACDRNRPGDAPRDLRGWRRRLLMYCLPVQVRLAGRQPRLVAALGGPPARQRRFLAAAVRDARHHGYRLGEHCLGGAYAVSAAAARALAGAGMLENPLITAGTGLGEDVVLGLLVRAAGFDLISLVDLGDPFTLTHAGLPAPAAELVSRGHAIVHSVKFGDPAHERSVRAEFAAMRGKSPAAGPPAGR
jgi:hypothetical protein